VEEVLDRRVGHSEAVNRRELLRVALEVDEEETLHRASTVQTLVGRT
jgi:hypothetical protein